MSIIQGGNVIEGSRPTFNEVIGAAALGVAAVHAAIVDTGAEQEISTGILALDRVRRLTATSAGTAADIGAIQVTIDGLDEYGVVIQEVMPIFTANNATTVTGVKNFSKVTLITVPAHDDVLATTSIGAAGLPEVADANGVMAALTDDGSPAVVTTGLNSPSLARNITATAGGTAGDVKAIQVIVVGLDIEGNAITETLPIFTVDTTGIVAGSKAFKKVTQVTIPAHDGTAATTAIGFGDILGLSRKLSRNSGEKGWLAETIEGTAPTFTVSAADIESNTVDLNSALNGTQVIVEYTDTD